MLGLPRTLAEDVGCLSIRELALASRLWLICMKYWSVATRAMGVPPPKGFRFCNRLYRCDSFIDAGFLLAHLADMRDSLKALGLLGRPGLSAIDVGAHHGETILAWHMLLDQPTVYAFEPNPDCLAILRQNVRGIPVRLFDVGLSDHDGWEAFDLDHRFSGWHTFVFGSRAPKRSVRVKAARGDDLIDLDHIDLLKIDVEGYEGQVLEGLRATLSRCHYVMVELSLERPKAYRFHEIARLLGEQPFELVRTGAEWREKGRLMSIDLWFERQSVDQPRP